MNIVPDELDHTSKHLNTSLEHPKVRQTPFIVSQSFQAEPFGFRG